MQTHNFILGPCDTDSISLAKPDGAEITEAERDALIDELNSLMPEHIQWDDDGYYPCVIAIRAKNYILKDEKGKVKIKGSALKATQKEKALKEFINKVIDLLLEEKKEDVIKLYKLYVDEIYNLKDIARWCSKKSITQKVLNAERTNEQKVLDAIQESDYVEGDKCYMYFAEDKSLKLQEHWSKDHNVMALLKKLYNTILTFETVLNMSQFPNYSLKKNENEGRIIGGIKPLIKIKRNTQ